MLLKDTYSVAETRQLFADVVTENLASTPKGQAHVNRIAKAITNQSLDKRKATANVTYATTAFNEALSEVAAKTPEMVTVFLAGKQAWVDKYIKKHYSEDE